MVSYRKILGQSLKTAWKHKYLWFFGFFALALAGNGAELEIFRRIFSGNTELHLLRLPPILNNGLFGSDVLRNIGGLFRTDLVSFFIAVTVFILLVLLAVFIVWLVIVSQTALIKNSALITAEEDNDLKSGVLAGWDKFWPVFSLNLANEFLLGILAFLITWPLSLKMLENPGIPKTIVYVIGFLLFVVIAMSISFTIKFAIAYKVIKNNSLIESVKNGWQLFRDNWLVSVEMAVQLFAINFLSIILILFLAFEMAAIYLLFVRIVFVGLVSVSSLAIILAIGSVILFLFLALCGSFLAVFQISAWTNLFMELVSGGGRAKIARLFGKILKQ